MPWTTFDIETRGPGLYEVTLDVQRWLRGRGDGLLALLIQHTSAALLIQENADPDVQRDLQAFFERLVPPADDPSMQYLRHTIEGADDMPAHIKAAMMPVSLSLPVRDGRACLGTWQGIYVFEFRDRPHRRRVVAQFIADHDATVP
jgi:secondary thiamine-phosphate synthase enzyme